MFAKPEPEASVVCAAYFGQDDPSQFALLDPDYVTLRAALDMMSTRTRLGGEEAGEVFQVLCGPTVERFVPSRLERPVLGAYSSRPESYMYLVADLLAVRSYSWAFVTLQWLIRWNLATEKVMAVRANRDATVEPLDAKRWGSYEEGMALDPHLYGVCEAGRKPMLLGPSPWGGKSWHPLLLSRHGMEQTITTLDPRLKVGSIEGIGQLRAEREARAKLEDWIVGEFSSTTDNNSVRAGTERLRLAVARRYADYCMGHRSPKLVDFARMLSRDPLPSVGVRDLPGSKFEFYDSDSDARIPFNTFGRYAKRISQKVSEFFPGLDVEPTR